MPNPRDSWSRALPYAAPSLVDVGTPGDWQPLTTLCEPAQMRRTLVDVAGRVPSADLAAVGSVLVRDLLAPITRLVVAAWCQDRVVLDVTPGNISVDVAGCATRLRLGEVQAFPNGSAPPALPELEAVLFDGTATAVIDGLRRVVRIGRRHLWGNVALAAVNVLASLSHRPGSPADADREALLARRPDLAALVETITARDGRGGTITYAVRRNCCLLAKLPPGTMCGTCSLRPRDERVRECDDHYRAERSRVAGGAATGQLR